MAETDELEKEFNDWWSTDGQYLDPDTSDVPWFDKRRGLAEYAFRAARCLDGWNDDMSAAKRDGTHYLIRLEGSSPPTVAHWFEDDPKLGGTGNPGWYLSVSQFAGPPVHPVAWQHISTRRPAPAGAEVGVRGITGMSARIVDDGRLDPQSLVLHFDHTVTDADRSAVLATLVSPPVEPQGEAVAGMAQTEGACLRIEMVASTLPKGSPGGGVLREAVSTIRHYAAPPSPQGDRT